MGPPTRPRILGCDDSASTKRWKTWGNLESDLLGCLSPEHVVIVRDHLDAAVKGFKSWMVLQLSAVRVQRPERSDQIIQEHQGHTPPLKRGSHLDRRSSH